MQQVDVDILTSEDIDIVLYGENNREIDKSGLSMGERQLYASALLSSLVSESEIDFPVFIDSQCKSLTINMLKILSNIFIQMLQNKS